MNSGDLLEISMDVNNPDRIANILEKFNTKVTSNFKYSKQDLLILFQFSTLFVISVRKLL